MQDLHTAWGERVRQERESLRISQRELAARCNVHPTTVLRIEAGELCPNDELKWKLAGALSIRMDVLWAWPQIIPPAPQPQRAA